jgi:hypothetical protein
MGSADDKAFLYGDGSAPSKVYVFTFGRTAYRIDLPPDQADAFDAVVDTYLRSARPIGEVRMAQAARPGRRGRANSEQIRLWAQRNDIYITEGEPLPADVIDAYNAWRYALEGSASEQRGRPRHASGPKPQDS